MKGMSESLSDPAFWRDQFSGMTCPDSGHVFWSSVFGMRGMRLRLPRSESEFKAAIVGAHEAGAIGAEVWLCRRGIAEFPALLDADHTQLMESAHGEQVTLSALVPKDVLGTVFRSLCQADFGRIPIDWQTTLSEPGESYYGGAVASTGLRRNPLFVHGQMGRLREEPCDEACSQWAEIAEFPDSDLGGRPSVIRPLLPRSASAYLAILLAVHDRLKVDFRRFLTDLCPVTECPWCHEERRHVQVQDFDLACCALGCSACGRVGPGHICLEGFTIADGFREFYRIAHLTSVAVLRFAEERFFVTRPRCVPLEEVTDQLLDGFRRLAAGDLRVPISWEGLSPNTRARLVSAEGYPNHCRIHIEPFDPRSDLEARFSSRWIEHLEEWAASQ